MQLLLVLFSNNGPSLANSPGRECLQRNIQSILYGLCLLIQAVQTELRITIAQLWENAGCCCCCAGPIPGWLRPSIVKIQSSSKQKKVCESKRSWELEPKRCKFSHRSLCITEAPVVESETQGKSSSPHNDVHFSCIQRKHFLESFFWNGVMFSDNYWILEGKEFQENISFFVTVLSSYRDVHQINLSENILRKHWKGWKRN